MLVKACLGVVKEEGVGGGTKRICFLWWMHVSEIYTLSYVK